MSDHDAKLPDTTGAHQPDRSAEGTLRPGSPIPDPGLPAHRPRPTDLDPKLARRAERQVATMFVISMLSTVGFVVAYFAIDPKQIVGVPGLGAMSASNLALGLLLGLALFMIGAGAIHWARTLMADAEMVQERHPLVSSQEDRGETLEMLRAGAEESGIGRRSLIRRTMIGALVISPLPALVLFRDLGPSPGDKLFHTAWREKRLLVNDNTGRPVRPADVGPNNLLFVRPGKPEVVEHVKEHPDATMHEMVEEGLVEGNLTELGKAAVLLIRLDPDEVRDQGSLEKGYEGILAFSKICTHVGCPVGLYEQQTHHLLCPCHQSTFDLADSGRVIFGPAGRALPQLEITVNEEGYLIAKGDFPEPVGPSFWEREI